MLWIEDSLQLAREDREDLLCELDKKPTVTPKPHLQSKAAPIGAAATVGCRERAAKRWERGSRVRTAGAPFVAIFSASRSLSVCKRGP